VMAVTASSDSCPRSQPWEAPKHRSRRWDKPPGMEVVSMYEVVKVVKGHEIKRMKGSRGFYHVAIRENVFCNFRTIKAAEAFIEATF